MGKLVMDIHYEKEADGLPDTCNVCPFNDILAFCQLDVNCYKGYEYVTRAKYCRQRHSKCPLKYED